MNQRRPSPPANDSQKPAEELGTVDSSVHQDQSIDPVGDSETNASGSNVGSPDPSVLDSVATHYRPDGGFSVDDTEGHGEATIDIPAEFGRSIYESPFDDSDSDREEPDEPSVPFGSDTLPQRVGRFRVKRELGRGAFGVVYLARDEQLERDVAIKLSLNPDARIQEKLRVEASKVAKVEGPGIVPVHEIGKLDCGAVYLVQKYIEGTSLRDFTSAKKVATVGQALILLRELALGLIPADDQDILHRDLKPDNILLDVNGKPFIADFGLAISEAEQQGRSRELAGTPPYMSPEQINARVDFMDARSDIWALGVIFYELLAGQLPFQGRGKAELTEQICKLDPKPLQEISEGIVSDDVEGVFRKCCAKAPADRFSSVRDLASTLEALIDQYAVQEDFLAPVGLDAKRATSPLGSYRRSASLPPSLGGAITERNTVADPSLLRPSVGSSPARSMVLWASALGFVCLAIGIGWFGWNRPTNDSTISLPEKTPGASVATLTAPGPTTEEAFISPEEREQQILDSYEADGSVLSPWRVARLGAASHRTIESAIARASAGDTITVAAGEYTESLTIDKPVRLVGLRSDGPVTLRGVQQAPLTIDCPHQADAVSIAGLDIVGQGHRLDSSGKQIIQDFNAIHLSGGTLELKNCELRTRSFNCVKLLEGTALFADNCQFLESEQCSISTRKHAMLEVKRCIFSALGIELNDGPGTIEGCVFTGSEGLYVQRTGEAMVDVRDCTFRNNTKYGLCVDDGGRVRSSANTFDQSTVGLMVNRSPEAKSPGIAQCEADQFNDCANAINVNGGTLLVQNDCTIVGGKIGVGIGPGSASIEDLEISACELMGIASARGTQELSLDRVQLKNCLGSGIQLTAGEVSATDLSVTNCGQFGVQILGTTQISLLTRLKITGGAIGLSVQPDENRSIDLTVRGGEFIKFAKLGLYAQGNTIVRLEDCDLTPLDLTQDEYFVAIAPSEILRVDGD